MRILFVIGVVCLLILPLYAQDASTSDGQKSIEHCDRFYAGSGIKTFSGKISNFELEGMKFSIAPSAIFEGIGYIGTDSGVVFSITSTDITRFSKLEGGGAIVGAPAVTKEYVFVGFSNNLFASFSRNDGKLLWKYETKGSVTTTPLAHDKFVYFTTSNGYCYCLDQETGAFKWRSNVLSKASSPAYETGVTLEKDIVIVGNNRQHVYGFNAQNGDKVWEYSHAGGQPLISDLRVFVSAIEGTVFALDKNTGDQDWHFRGELVPGTTDFALANNTLVFGNGTSIIALDSRSGEGFKWQKDLLHPLSGAPIIVGDVVYASCKDEKIYAFDLETGKQYGHADIGYAPEASPAFAKGKILYPNGEKILIISGE